MLTAIIKLGLKTLLECVRLQTFGRYGLQQMQVEVKAFKPTPFISVQVDCHYLQLYLWRFVADEAVVQQLLEEVSHTHLSSFHQIFERCLALLSTAALSLS